MLKLRLPIEGKAFKILCLGAHSDDIEIGCGGTIMRILEENKNVEVHWVVFSAKGKRAYEARQSAAKFLSGAGHKEIIVKNFKDGYFPLLFDKIKDFLEKFKIKLNPDLVFTHYRNDLHQDHRLISDLTWNTYRNHLILEYEVVKYDGDMGSPHIFVHLDGETCQKKIEIIRDHFKSQAKKDWFIEDTFYAILRLRGVESRAPEKYAEAFYCRKAVI